MKFRTKRLATLFLAATMLLTAIPSGAYAAPIVSDPTGASTLAEDNTVKDRTVAVGDTITLQGTEGYDHSWNVIRSVPSGAVSTEETGNTINVTGEKVSTGAVLVAHYYHEKKNSKRYITETFTVTVTAKEESATEATSLDIVQDSADVMVGKTTQLTVNVEPAKAKVTWSSEDKNIATVDANGKVTGVAEGEVEIVARSGDLVDVATVKVTRDTSKDEKGDAYFYIWKPGTAEDTNYKYAWYYAGKGSVKLPKATASGKAYYDTSYVLSYPSSYPDIVADGITYKYSTDTTAENTYHIEWASIGDEWGANNGDSTNYLTTSPVYHVNGYAVLHHAEKFTIDFKVKDAGSNSFVSVANWPKVFKKDAAVTAPSVDTTKTVNQVEYTFDGWYKDEACTVKATEADFVATANTTFYGKYDYKRTLSYKLTINYVYEDGTTAATSYSDNVTYGKGYNVASPAVAGYTPDKAAVAGTMPAKDQTFTVTYKKSSFKLTVKYQYEDKTQAKPDHTETLAYNAAYSVTSPAITGYTPDKATVAGNMPGEDTTITVTYTKNSYKLTVNYQYEDKSKAADSVEKNLGYGEAYDIASPEIAGYTASQTKVSGNMPNEAKTVTVTYTANTNTKYTVKHYQQNADDPAKYTLVETDTTKYGKTGDKTAASANEYEGFTAKKFDQVTITGDGKAVVEIKYDRKEYEVTYAITGSYFTNAKYTTKKYKFGADITLIKDDMTKAGYTWNGWTGAPADGKMPAHNITISGSYSPAAVNYTVKHLFEDLSGKYVADSNYPDQVMSGTTGSQTNAQALSVAGFTAGTVSQKTITADGKTVVEIKYSRNAYTILYKVEGAYFANDSFKKIENVKYGSAISLIKDKMEKTGYTWDGWKGMPTDGKMPADNLTITGFYTAATDTPYTVQHRFETVDGTEYVADRNYPNQTLTGTTGAQTLASAYNVTGFTAQSFSQTTIAADGKTVVTINYKRNVHTITYAIIAQLFAQDPYYVQRDVKYGTPIVLIPDNMEKEGYKWHGWNAEPGTKTMPDRDIRITGHYSPKEGTKYTVTHLFEDLNGKYVADSNYPDQVMSGTTGSDTAATAYTVTGFTAQTITQTKIAANGKTVVTVKYDRNKHDVIYKVTGSYFVNNEFHKDSDVKYGAALELIKDNMAKDGYEWSGWSTLPATMPDKDVIITGSYSLKSYTLKINYVYEDGKTAATKYEKSTAYGSDYNVTSPAVAGYTADQTSVTGKMPARDTEVTVTYKANTNTAYKVEHYQQNSNNNEYTLVETENGSGTTGNKTAAAAKSYTGFTAKSFDQVTITGDGKAVVKIYYDRKTWTITYKITGSYNKNDSYKVINNVKYGSSIALITDNMAQTGYTWNGWTGMPADGKMPNDNLTILGSYAAATDTKYTVKHLFEGLDGTYAADAAYSDQVMAGETDTKTAAAAYTVTGFTAQKVEQKKIAANGSTVVEIKYDRNAHTVTYAITGDYFADEAYSVEKNVKYGTTLELIADDMAKEGYTWSEWDGMPEGAVMPDEDVTLTGSYSVNSYRLVIHYVDEAGNTLAEDYDNEVAFGSELTVASPAVAGYTPEYASVSTPEDGMPAQDLEFTIVYTQNPVEPTPEDPENPENPENPGTPTNTNTNTDRVAEEVVAQEEAPAAQIVMDKDGNAELEITDDAAPQAAKGNGAWALINLISMIATALLSILLLVLYFTGKKEEDEEKEASAEKEEELKRKGLARLMSIIPAIGAVILFFVTEDLTQKMALTDKWTIVMILILLVNVVLTFFSKKEKKEEEK